MQDLGVGEGPTKIFVTREEVPLLCGLQRRETGGYCATSASPPYWVNGVQPGQCNSTEINFYKPHSQYREPLQWGLPLCPLGDRSGSQELASLKTVATAGSWQLEDSF